MQSYRPFARTVRSGDSAALRAALVAGTALCTLVGVDGGFSRRVGAQLAIPATGEVIGSLADGCLEAELAGQAAEARAAQAPRTLRYGAGSPFIDFRLPCGAGVDVVVDPCPDRAELGRVATALDRREPAVLAIPGADRLPALAIEYLPAVRVVAMGAGPEVAALEDLCRALSLEFEAFVPTGGLSSAKPPEIAVDPWTAVVFLFHDHDWERVLLPWALETPAYLVGAIGGAKTRAQREEMLAGAGLSRADIARVRAPLGLIPATRDPATLALAVLAEIVRDYQAMIDSVSPGQTEGLDITPRQVNDATSLQ